MQPLNLVLTLYCTKQKKALKIELHQRKKGKNFQDYMQHIRASFRCWRNIMGHKSARQSFFEMGTNVIGINMACRCGRRSNGRPYLNRLDRIKWSIVFLFCWTKDWTRIFFCLDGFVSLRKKEYGIKSLWFSIPTIYIKHKRKYNFHKTQLMRNITHQQWDKVMNFFVSMVYGGVKPFSMYIKEFDYLV